MKLLTIPKLSTPLAKSIRTSEGIMVWVVNIAIALATTVEGINVIPHNDAAILISVNLGLHGLYRTMLKTFALQKEVGIEAPIPFEGDEALIEGKPETSIKPNGPEPLPTPPAAEAPAA